MTEDQIARLSAALDTANARIAELEGITLGQIVDAVRLVQTVSQPAPAGDTEPALPIAEAIKPDRVYCLVCGQGFQSLKRHLHSVHDLAPDTYRARFNLPRDFPMVAPDYAAKRSELAKASGLGRYRGTNDD